MAQGAVAEAPANADAHLELAARYAALGRAEEAERSFRTALRRDPRHAQARDELTAFLALHGRWDEASSILLAGGSDAATRLKYAHLLLARRDLAGADRVLRELEAGTQLADPVAELRAKWRALQPP